MFEEVRIVLLFAMLAVLAYYDIKQRTTNDMIFLIFGGFGAFLYLFDYSDVTFFKILTMGASSALGLLLWRFRVFGTGDLFAIAAISVIYPVYHDMIPIPIVLLIGGYLLAAVVIPSLNFYQNIHDWIRDKKPFEEISEPGYKKFAALFMVHRKRKKENLTFLVEKKIKGKRVLFLGTKDPNMEFAGEKNNGMYVEYTTPLLAFVFATGVLFFGILNI